MAVFLDPEHWTIRGGPDARKFGDPYSVIAQGQVQDDRSFYLYGAVGSWLPADVRAVIAEARALAAQWHWTGILWERKRPDGTSHVFKIAV